MLKCEECGQELVNHNGCVVCVSTWCGQVLRPVNYKVHIGKSRARTPMIQCSL
jgi:uncharacterized Zn finger protein (UPF0148 family)